ncbi:MAG: MMPL family transporter [Chloroflexi bacterium]|nr:MMPL family transporter [Chloroflexota bacterium]MCI0890299.1 MMPL family transporter [Chloroflexota bacterium]
MNEAPETEAQSFTARIAMWSARHRRLVVLAWFILVILAFGACSVIEADTDVELVPPGDAGEAMRLFDDRFGETERGETEFIVFTHRSLTVDDPAYEETVQGLRDVLVGLVAENTAGKGSTTVVSDTRVVASITTHYDIGAPDPSPFVAKRDGLGDVSFIIVEMEGDSGEAVDNVGLVLNAVAAYEAAPGFQSGAADDAILIGGGASLNKQLTEMIDEDFGQALFLNLPVTFVILILAFGALLAAFVPLILAFTAVFVAVAILTIISQVFALDPAYEQIVLLMGLATGIDYALFVITRYRNERRAGRSKDDALRVASGTSGKAVVFAGATTVFAVGAMFLVGDKIFSSLGLAAIVVVLVAVVISMTLLPALIAFLGDNIDRFSVPFLGRPQEEGTGIWNFIIDRVLQRPVIFATFTIVGLLAITAPILTMNLGFNGVRSFHDDVAGKKALIKLEENFTLGLVQPAVIVVDAGEKGNVFDPEIQDSVAELIRLVGLETVSPTNPDAFFGQIAQEPEFNDAGDTEAGFIPINADSGDDHAIDAVNHLRDDLIPQAFVDSSARVLVTGATAANIDFRANIIFRSPFVFIWVLVLAFIILLLVFRSVVIAGSAILLNMLSVGFAYGLLVLVFQEGFLLEGVLDFEATGIIESWLPLFLFSIIFGLSIDYEMFVMSRIKEHHEQGLSTDEAISRGLKGTAGVITNAAAIMVGVATIFAFMRNIGLQQFGFGLAAAVLIDATVIRAFVLPTTMKLLGEWNWYLPSWLEWLPEIKMGE